MRLWGWLLLWTSLCVLFSIGWILNAILDQIHAHLQMHLDDERARTIALHTRRRA